MSSAQLTNGMLQCGPENNCSNATDANPPSTSSASGSIAAPISSSHSCSADERQHVMHASATTSNHAELDSFDEEDDDDVVYETMDDSPMMVQRGLFIGSFMAEQNKHALKKHGITHILQVMDGVQPSHPGEFQYRAIDVVDAPSEDLVVHFQQCFEFMDEAASQQGAVLVHCLAGVSRSATVCIGYLMWKQNISYEEAFKQVQSVRAWIMPNSGFKKQLLEFEKLGRDLSKWRAWKHMYKEELLPKRKKASSLDPFA